MVTASLCGDGAALRAARRTPAVDAAYALRRRNTHLRLTRRTHRSRAAAARACTRIRLSRCAHGTSQRRAAAAARLPRAFLSRGVAA